MLKLAQLYVRLTSFIQQNYLRIVFVLAVTFFGVGFAFSFGSPWYIGVASIWGAIIFIAFLFALTKIGIALHEAAHEWVKQEELYGKEKVPFLTLFLERLSEETKKPS